MKLKELTTEMIQFEKFCEENPELDEQTKTDTLDSIKLPFNKKALGVACVMKNIGVPIAAIDKEIERLQAHKKAITGKVSWLKSYLRDNMIAAKIEVIEDDLIKIRLQKGRAKLEIVCEVDQLPKKYRKTKMAIVAETELIKTVLESGKKIPGCKLTKTPFVKFY